MVCEVKTESVDRRGWGKTRTRDATSRLTRQIQRQAESCAIFYDYVPRTLRNGGSPVIGCMTQPRVTRPFIVVLSCPYLQTSSPSLSPSSDNHDDSTLTQSISRPFASPALYSTLTQFTSHISVRMHGASCPSCGAASDGASKSCASCGKVCSLAFPPSLRSHRSPREPNLLLIFMLSAVLPSLNAATGLSAGHDSDLDCLNADEGGSI